MGGTIHTTIGIQYQVSDTELALADSVGREYAAVKINQYTGLQRQYTTVSPLYPFPMGYYCMTVKKGPFFYPFFLS